MKIPLSNRLMTCCSFVQQGDRVADIGCDHGYLGIYLLTSGIAASVIASDINEMPLQSAVKNAAKYHVSERISFFISAGVQNIPRDFDTLVCAGMGADTMISILEAAPWLKNSRYRLILQCQSKRPELRKYLIQEGYSISRETLSQDGKFIYPVMEVIYKPCAPLFPWEYYITPALLSSGSPLLEPFMGRVISGLEETIKGLTHTGSAKLDEYRQITERLQMQKRSLIK